MSLYKRPLDDILDAIKRLNKGVVLNESEYLFGQPQVITPDEAGNNTLLSIESRGNASAFEGSVSVSYRRNDLADLEVMLPGSIKATGITDVTKFAEVLNRYYGFAFAEGDLINDPINLVEGSGEVTIRAQEFSMGWVGQATFLVEPGRTEIARYVTTRILPGLGYPNRLATKPFGEMFSYPNDFSAHFADLRSIDPQNVQEADWTKIINALQQVTGQTFVRNEAKRYSLRNATIDYSGTTEDYARSNKNYSHILVITLDEPSSLGLSGQLMLHHTAPDTEFD